MSTLKLIIDIDEDTFARLFDNGIQDNEIATDDICEMARAIRKGTPLDKIRAEIEQKIEHEKYARSVFRYEEKDAVKAEQCTGSIFAYRSVIKFIDIYKAESEGKR